ncbi:glucose-6-phosphate dehydrogenase [Coprobacter tertius]|uniref:Glucose-6-phosphate 1-dehydrogenase n=1 Tax=Coprobacter tertius TaxID=2944915 RepID=A0ABT1MJV2_9BACT|nr:glucose-6-phosphate dehydrogenase [Coprobacter tertius]MCP9612146.1 glucose-6-phosphate dehydrogenase [Coprobacter tertius]
MKEAENQMLVIFGASGDLTRRKLIPALFELYVRRLLPEKFIILGAARSLMSNEEFRRKQSDYLSASSNISLNSKELGSFLELIYYVAFDTDNCKEYVKLKEMIVSLQKEKDIPDNIIFYLATPPAMYEVIPPFLKAVKLNVSLHGGTRKIIVEKPFGTDLKSAKRLNRKLELIFNEKEIYRIDHYLGKETVQNILVLRFSNGIFEPLWNRNYIDYVEISSSETLGIENRGKYYETAGALRDMIQNHLMQLMAFIAMEPPASFDPESIRDEIAKVFRSLRAFSTHDCHNSVIRGQYTDGEVEGETVVGYRKEKEVAADSNTETYVAMRYMIDNWRWSGIPFFIFTGKRLKEKRTEITIHFKSTPQQFFKGQCAGSSCNQLIIRVQPDESISMKFGLKIPGAGFEVKQVSMDFYYDSLKKDKLPDAYERLLLDAMLGDSTLYSRSDALEASWRFIDPIEKEWMKHPTRNLLYYKAGSNGPRQNLIGPEIFDSGNKTKCDVSDN